MRSAGSVLQRWHRAGALDVYGKRASILAAFLTAVAPVAVITSALSPRSTRPSRRRWQAAPGSCWRARRGDLLWAGALFGVALLSKYSAATLLPGFALIALRDPEARGWLRRGEVWIAIALAAALFAPRLYWNATHDFVSLAFQIRHASGGGFAPQTLMAFAGTELLGAGPLTLLLALPFLWRARNAPAQTLAALTILPLLWFANLPRCAAGSRQTGRPFWTRPSAPPRPPPFDHSPKAAAGAERRGQCARPPWQR